MAQLDKTAVDAVAQEVISAFVQQRLAEKSVLLGSIIDRSSDAVKGSDSVSLGRHGALTAADKAEGAAYASQSFTWAADKIALDGQAGVYVQATRKGMNQATPDQESDILASAADALVKKLEGIIYAQLMLASSSAPDHQINFATASTLALADILSCRTLLRTQEVPFDDNDCFIAINPAQESQLLGLEQFIDASRYGNSLAIMNGELGRIYGFRVLVSNSVTAATAIAYHRSHVAFAMQGEVTWEKQRLLKDSVSEFLLEAVYGAKVLDTGKRGVVLTNA